MGRLVALALLLSAFLLPALLPSRAEAQTGARVALVVGNSAYRQSGTLANPVNDATDVAARLRGLGFTVIEGRDLGKRELERKIGDFADALDNTAVGLFYYAGHGLGVNGRNYMVPVDARLDVLLKLQLEAVPLDEVLEIMQAEAKVSLVFLDTCSNNPFAQAGRSARPLAGFAPVELSDNSFVAFSTQEGATASDGAGRNSPFAAALLSHIGEPGRSIYDLMQEVRRDVRAATRRSQVPFVKDSLLDPFSFVPAGGPPPAASLPPPAPPAEVAALDRSLGEEGAIEDFIERDYLAPASGAVEQRVRRLYGPRASIFGAPLSLDAIVEAKTDWFSQWASWRLTIEPGSLSITRTGADRADAVFAMSYDYVPKSASAARLAGRARVSLGLARGADGWRIVSEASEALN